MCFLGSVNYEWNSHVLERIWLWLVWLMIINYTWVLSYPFLLNALIFSLFLSLLFSFPRHTLDRMTIVVVCRCTQIKTYSWDNAQVVLVGNKCDMEDERVISFERGKQLADSLGLEFFETSAKENVNVRVRLVGIIKW